MSKVIPSFKTQDNIIHIIEEETYNAQTTKRIGVSSSPKKRVNPKMTPVYAKDTSIPSYQSIQNEFIKLQLNPPKKLNADVFPCNIQRYHSAKEIKGEEIESESDISSFELDSD